MIRKYEEPILRIKQFAESDCIRTSADNLICDDFDDYSSFQSGVQ